MKYAAILATLAAVSLAALTADADTYNYSRGIITRLETFGDEVIVHGLDLSPNPAGCTKPHKARLKQSLTAAQKAGLVRMLTAAFTAGRQVNVLLSPTQCSADQPAIVAVRVR
jgi:hypothetical protein